MKTLQPYILTISKLCETHNVDKLYVFGSILTDRFCEESDIDFVVRFKSVDLLQYADNYFELKYSLEKLLKHRVDLLEEQALKNPYFLQTIQENRRLIYG